MRGVLCLLLLGGCRFAIPGLGLGSADAGPGPGSVGDAGAVTSDGGFGDLKGPASVDLGTSCVSGCTAGACQPCCQESCGTNAQCNLSCIGCSCSFRCDGSTLCSVACGAGAHCTATAHDGNDAVYT